MYQFDASTVLLQLLLQLNLKLAASTYECTNHFDLLRSVSSLYSIIWSTLVLIIIKSSWLIFFLISINSLINILNVLWWEIHQMNHSCISMIRFSMAPKKDNCIQHRGVRGTETQYHFFFSYWYEGPEQNEIQIEWIKASRPSKGRVASVQFQASRM